MTSMTFEHPLVKRVIFTPLMLMPWLAKICLSVREIPWLSEGVGRWTFDCCPMRNLHNLVGVLVGAKLAFPIWATCRVTGGEGGNTGAGVHWRGLSMPEDGGFRGSVITNSERRTRKDELFDISRGIGVCYRFWLLGICSVRKIKRLRHQLP